MAAVGSYSETLSGWCGSHEGFERKKTHVGHWALSIILYNQALVGGLSDSILVVFLLLTPPGGFKSSTHNCPEVVPTYGVPYGTRYGLFI